MSETNYDNYFHGFLADQNYWINKAIQLSGQPIGKNSYATANFQTRQKTMKIFQGRNIKLKHLGHAVIINTKFPKEKPRGAL